MPIHNFASTSVIDLCARIKNMGYAASKRVKLYGEEYEIVSDPFPEDQGIAVRVKTKNNPAVRMIRLPSTILQSVLGRRTPSAA
jgi:hypothetical protein